MRGSIESAAPLVGENSVSNHKLQFLIIPFSNVLSKSSAKFLSKSMPSSVNPPFSSPPAPLHIPPGRPKIRTGPLCNERVGLRHRCWSFCKNSFSKKITRFFYFLLEVVFFLIELHEFWDPWRNIGLHPDFPENHQIFASFFWGGRDTFSSLSGSFLR